MKFIEVCKVLEKLSSTSKRLEKILILRDFLLTHKKNGPLVFDIISGNYQRKIEKKSLAISIKTVTSVLSFLSNKSENFLDKQFNSIGDIGEVANLNVVVSKSASLLAHEDLELKDIILAFDQISARSGHNSNKIKKEVLTKLFFKTTSKLEVKYLSRLLVDDLRVGVSEGVLKEACVNSLFPQLIGIHNICEKCSYVNFASKKCISCGNDIDLKIQYDLFSKYYKVIDVETPQEIVGLNNFISTRNEEEHLKYLLRQNRNIFVLNSKNPREYYNNFLALFELKYNILNSFTDVLVDLFDDLQRVTQHNIIVGVPIRSMLGTRASNIDESFDMTGLPSILDYKYDGLRVQIHNNYGSVSLFSRNLDNITKQFPEIVEYVEKNFGDISFVIDSECVGFDFKKGTFLPFQMLSKRILTKNYGEVSHIHVVTKFFDIMFLNGETLIGKNFEKRREKLLSILINRKLKQKMLFDLDDLKKIK